jgi:hypothetical protein
MWGHVPISPHLAAPSPPTASSRSALWRKLRAGECSARKNLHVCLRVRFLPREHARVHDVAVVALADAVQQMYLDLVGTVPHAEARRRPKDHRPTEFAHPTAVRTATFARRIRLTRRRRGPAAVVRLVRRTNDARPRSRRSAPRLAHTRDAGSPIGVPRPTHPAPGGMRAHTMRIPASFRRVQRLRGSGTRTRLASGDDR